ncbi:MAG: DUF4126 domain-containing protein [Bryobacterales bacterium]|nr:DUF4126 domain-containing protein [Bryobacterales bacterium]
METLQLIASATGLGVLAGVRLYLTVLCLGLAVRFEWLELGQSFSQLQVLGDWRVIGVAAIAVLLEFFADKIPWLDSAWDSLHTFIRPVGAAVLSVAAFESIDPGMRTILVLLTGGAALTSHSAKAATRMAVNYSPEPFSNLALSLAGDVAVPVSLWLLMEYPLVVGGIAAVFLLLMAMIAPRVYRILRVHVIAIRSCLGVWLGDAEAASSTPVSLDALQRESAVELPEVYARSLRKEYGQDAAFALHGVFRRGAGKLRNRVGYLCVLPDRFVLMARRPWGMVTQELPHESVGSLRFEERFLMDGLRLRDPKGELSMDLFKEISAGGRRLATAWSTAKASA